MERVYFDNAATTPIDPNVLEVMTAALRDYPGNPSSIHAEGRKARAAIERARKQVAGLLQASIGEIFFTSCGTESNNMVLKGAVRDLGVERIISTRTEHHAVLHTLQRMAESVEVVFLDQSTDGQPDLEQLQQLLADGGRKTLVSLMHANNEIGTLLNLEQVGSLCAEYGALFHSDTVQTVGYYPIDLSQGGVHFITGSAHKFHGPKGVGFVYINSDYLLQPFIDGGAQERNMRGGTENTAGIVGLAHALELAYANLEARAQHILDVRNYLAEQLRTHLPGVVFNGDPFNCGHFRILSVDFPPDEKSEMLLLNLDIAGISVSGGSACSSGADAGSHVMDALKKDSLNKTVRFSFSHLNTRAEVNFVLERLLAK